MVDTKKIFSVRGILTIVASVMIVLFFATSGAQALNADAEKGFKEALGDSQGLSKQDCQQAGGTYSASKNTCTKNGETVVAGSSVPKVITNMINLLLFVAGAIAALMIVIGGFRYVASNGDSGSASKARDTILYAAIGLVVASLAYVLVNFILESI